VIEADGAAEALRVVTQRGAPPDLVIVEEVVSDRAPAGGNGADHAGDDGDDGDAAGLPAAELVAQIHTLYAQMPALVIRQAEGKGDGNGALPSLVAPLTVEQVARRGISGAAPEQRLAGAALFWPQNGWTRCPTCPEVQRRPGRVPPGKSRRCRAARS
jgi:hypothetical protein